MDRLAEALDERLWLGWVAGGVLWLAWIVSIIIGGGQYDAFNQLVCTDHLAFYSAARMIRDGRAAEIYDNPAMAARQVELVGERWENKYESYRNLPYYALLYVPTAGLSYPESAAIWTAISLAALYLGTLCLGGGRNWRTLAWLACFYPTFASISYGQNTPLSFAVLAVTFLLLKHSGGFDTSCEPLRKSDRNRWFLLFAGIVAGFLSFKPTLLIGLVVWGIFDIRRLWPCVIGVCVTILALSGISFLLIPECWTSFFGTFASNASFDQMEWWKNLTPRAFWRLLLGDSSAVGPLTIAASFAGIAWFFIVWRNARNRLAAMVGASVVLTLWSTPHAMVYEWGLLAIPAILWWNDPVVRGGNRPSHWKILFFFVGLLALVGPPLTQIQLHFWPNALHFCVVGFGWSGWLAGKWLVQSSRTA